MINSILEPNISEELKEKMMGMAEILVRASFPECCYEDSPNRSAHIAGMAEFLHEVVRSRAIREGQAEIDEESLREIFLLFLDCISKGNSQCLLTAFETRKIDAVEGSIEERVLKALGLIPDGINRRLTDESKRLFAKAGLF